MTVGDVVPAVVTGTTATEIQARAGRLDVRIPKAGSSGPARPTASALVARGRPGAGPDRATRGIAATPPSRASIRNPSCRAASSRSTTAPGASSRWSAASTSTAASSTAPIQASRQLGSTFKLVVYTAAIDRGYTPASTLLDAPVSFPGGAGSPPYAPLNYDREFEGPISLRRALEQSRNVPTVRLMNALGPKQVVQYAKKLGITSTIPPYLSSALGAGEATLLEITNAFSLFPNQGVRMTPYEIVRVTDREGNALEENRPVPTRGHSCRHRVRHDRRSCAASCSAAPPRVPRSSIGRSAARPAPPTTSPTRGSSASTRHHDRVWVGFDTKRPIGQGQSGAVAALPIWIDVMQHWVERQRKAGKPVPEFPAPGNIVFAADETGRQEAFIAGTSRARRFADANLRAGIVNACVRCLMLRTSPAWPRHCSILKCRSSLFLVRRRLAQRA